MKTKEIDIANLLPPVWNQKKLKACTAITICDLAYHHLKNESDSSVEPFSPLFLYYNSRRILHKENINANITIEHAFQAGSTYGLCSESKWPFISANYRKKPSANVYDWASEFKHLEFEALPQSFELLKKSLQQGRPFLFGLRLFPDNAWHFRLGETAKTGKIRFPKSFYRPIDNHAVIATVYDSTTDTFTVRNSFGTHWGKHGYFELPSEYLLHPNGAYAFYRSK